jgi:hypothetical protein
MRGWGIPFLGIAFPGQEYNTNGIICKSLALFINRIDADDHAPIAARRQ